MDKFNKITLDLINCGEKISSDQKIVGLLNALDVKYKDIRNVLEHGKDDLIVDIIYSFLKNRELELRSEHKKALHAKTFLSYPKSKSKEVSNYNQVNHNKNFTKKRGT